MASFGQFHWMHYDMKYVKDMGEQIAAENGTGQKKP